MDKGRFSVDRLTMLSVKVYLRPSSESVFYAAWLFIVNGETEEKRNTGAMKDITEPVRKLAVEQLLERVILHGMQSKSINVCEYARRRKREKNTGEHT